MDYMKRLKIDRLYRKLDELAVRRKRPRGTPRRRWLVGIKRDVGKEGMEWQAVEDKDFSRKRERWLVDVQTRF